ncbi:hypothetical protein TNCT_186121 [Trichonephila clavata]|uniref:Uncharacterized protein n=1 Tax=Trichonephila clavata TaxID=2740835 RepID=A0A8X6F669_TRICU|nr:hypothetical protein TNCT_186121 [Trichonephila clavata]
MLHFRLVSPCMGNDLSGSTTLSPIKESIPDENLNRSQKSNANAKTNVSENITADLQAPPAYFSTKESVHHSRRKSLNPRKVPSEPDESSNPFCDASFNIPAPPATPINTSPWQEIVKSRQISGKPPVKALESLCMRRGPYGACPINENARNENQKRRPRSRKLGVETIVQPHLRDQILALPIPPALPSSIGTVHQANWRGNARCRKTAEQFASFNTAVYTPETPALSAVDGNNRYETRKIIKERLQRRIQKNRKTNDEIIRSTDVWIDLPEWSAPTPAIENFRQENFIINQEYRKATAEAWESPDLMIDPIGSPEIIIVKEIIRHDAPRKRKVAATVSTNTSFYAPEPSTSVQKQGWHSGRVAEKVTGMITQDGRSYLVVKWFNIETPEHVEINTATPRMMQLFTEYRLRQGTVSTDTSIYAPVPSTSVQEEGFHSERVAEKVTGMITRDGKSYLLVKWFNVETPEHVEMSTATPRMMQLFTEYRLRQGAQQCNQLVAQGKQVD